MKFDWLLFDADGTLFDFERAEVTAFTESFRFHDLPCNETTLATYQQINNALWKQFEQGQVSAQYISDNRFPLLFERLGLPGDPLAFNETYLEKLGEQTWPVDGAHEVVEALSRAHRLALLSNGLSRVQRKRLSLSPIGKYFRVVVISEEVGASKPDPKIFEAAFAQMGNPPREKVLMIGDSLSADVAGALRYGMPVCWFNPDGSPGDPALQGDYEINRLAELLAITGSATG